MKKNLLSFLAVLIANIMATAQPIACPVSMNAVTVVPDAVTPCNTLLRWERNNWQAFYHVYLTNAMTNMPITDLITDADSLYVRDFGDSLLLAGVNYRATVKLVDAVAHQDLPQFVLLSQPFTLSGTPNIPVWCPIDTSLLAPRFANNLNPVMGVNGVIENNVVTRSSPNTSLSAANNFSLDKLKARGLTDLNTNTPIRITWINNMGQAYTPSVPNAPAGSHPLATDWNGLANLLKERLTHPTNPSGLILTHKYDATTKGVERRLTTDLLNMTTATPVLTLQSTLTQYIKTLPQTVASYNLGSVYEQPNNAVLVEAYLIW
jgi:hypothetical protein